MKNKMFSKILSLMLVLSMVMGMCPVDTLAAPKWKQNVYAVDEEATTENTEKVLSYAAQMRNANVKNDYSKGNFSWDTENKNDSWRYFNGLMLDAFLMIGDADDIAYADAFYAGNVNSDGTIKNYIAGELDSVETARGLFDVLEAANADKYKKAIQYVYSQLEKQTVHSQCGGNLRHKESNWGTYEIALDGLYMAQPFLMECANAIDEGKLALTDGNGQAVDSASIYEAVYNRFDWIAKNLRDSKTGLYNHACTSAGKVNGCFWSRAIGWYAMALIDVIDMMPEGEMRDGLISHLPALYDGMLKYQDAGTGMWYNVVNRKTELSKNILETSGTAMMAYSMMKAYNMGVADAKYGEAGLKAFNGTVANKVQNTANGYKVVDTYLKSGVATSDSGYCNNGYTVDEAKGTGALIMAATLAADTYNKLNGPEEPEQPTDPEIPAEIADEETGIVVAGSGAASVAVTDKTGDPVVAEALKEAAEKFVAYDITLEGYTQGTEASVSIPVPEEFDADRTAVYYVSDDGSAVEKMDGAVTDGKYTFKTAHFSIYALGETRETVVDPGNVSGDGILKGNSTTEYVLADQIENGETYLVLSAKTGDVQALRNYNGSAASQAVSIPANGTITAISNAASCEWTAAAFENGWTFSNGTGRSTRYILGNSTVIGNTQQALEVEKQNDGGYQLSYSVTTGGGWGQPTTTTHYYIGYYRSDNSSWNSSWNRSSNTAREVYLFKKNPPTADAAVKFTLSPKDTTLMQGETFDLNSNVTVNGRPATSSDITWDTSDDTVATVQNGRVTAAADGTATITATLNRANGTNLVNPIVLEVFVTVQSKAATGYKLTGNETVTIQKGENPDFSNIKLEITYGDGTIGKITVDNGLVIEGYDKDKSGRYLATISYQGKEYGKVVVIVEGLPEASEYPEYPKDGSVRIDKKATANAHDFNNTGVAHVELDVAGVSSKKGVDVVLVIDVSNSMSWKAGTKIDAAAYNKDDNKLKDVMNSVKEFAGILLNKDEETLNTNTVSIVTFAGYDESWQNDSSNSYIDSVQTLGERLTNVEDVKYIADNSEFTGADQLTLARSNKTTVSGSNMGGTNYDYAFAHTEDVVKNIKNVNGEDDRSVYVVFMTDGAADHYENYGYKDVGARNCLVGNKTTKYPTLPGTGGTATPNVWLDYLQKNPGLRYAEKVYNQVDGIYTVGFDLNNGGFKNGNTLYQYGADTLVPILNKLVCDENGNGVIDVELAENKVDLLKFYQSMATAIKYAGTSAVTTDTIGEYYTLQTSALSGGGEEGSKTAVLQDYGITPKITVTAYDLWTAADEDLPDDQSIGKRKGTSSVLEEVTFSGDGKHAFSNVIGNTVDIMTIDGDTMIINARYFKYTKESSGVEKFEWYIGDITAKEVALGYDVYLKDSLEGGRPEDIYYTNEGAELEYVDSNGKYAHKTYPKPALNWGGATTTIRLYLVNQEGQPVNHDGTLVTDGNLVYVGDPIVIPLNLNEGVDVEAQQIFANQHVPEEYYLYDENAWYKVVTSSGDDKPGSIKRSPAKENETINTTLLLDYEEVYYTWSYVGFGVLWDNLPKYEDQPLEKDQVVLDYGKAIEKNVLDNDKEVIEDGYVAELVGFTEYNSRINLTAHQKESEPADETYESDNGTYTLATQNGVQVAHFELKKFLSEVDKVFCIIKLTNKNNAEDVYYMYEELDIIPATNVYYETDFAEGVFTFRGGEGDHTWDTVPKTSDTTAKDYLQDTKEIGKDLYGFDSSYENDLKYSNEDSYVVLGDDPREITSNFSFKGTGFDIISMTGEDEGFIRVSVFADEEKKIPEKKITVLNKSESSLTLYQIPVVSVEDLTYGTHYVEIGVSGPVSGMPEALNNGGQFHFDAVRIFNPIDASGKDFAIAYEAYAADKEADATLTEVRNILITNQAFDENANGQDGAVFVDREQSNVGMSDYAQIGPNNEVYLTSTEDSKQLVGFKLQKVDGKLPASIDIGAKSADGFEVKLEASVYSLDEDGKPGENPYTSIVKTIKSSTIQFFDLFEGDGNSIEAAYGNSDSIYIVIRNGENDTGKGSQHILSITDLKVAYGKETGTTRIFSDLFTLNKTMALAMPEKTAAVYTAYVDGKAYVSGEYNTKVALHADKENFVCWMAGDDENTMKPVSADPNYTFFLAKDIYLKAVYEESEETKIQPTAAIINTLAEPAASGKINAKFVGQLTLPEGTKILEAGLVWSAAEDTVLDLNSGAKVTNIKSINTAYQFSVTINGVPAGKSVRGVVFAKIQLADGKTGYMAESVIYSAERKIANQ